MPKTNYVIATWSGKNTKRSTNLRSKWSQPTCENTLKVHLQQILKFKNQLTQITIMKPFCDPEIQYDTYYDLDTLISQFAIPVVYMECENFGYSNGQWLKCYETYRDQFDYYIFIEDDYCPFTDNFDQHLIDCYTTKFSAGIGKLCGFVEGYPRQTKHSFPMHYESIVLVSSKTLDLLYNHWNGKPREALDTNIENTSQMSNLKKAYAGAFYQINFSLLFTKIGIPLDDYCCDAYPVPYYQESPDHMCYLVNGYTSGSCCVKFPIHSIKDVKQNGSYICVPVQFTTL